MGASGQTKTLMVMVLAFVAPLEALAGIFAFLARDSGAATALSMLGAAWAATALTVLGEQPGGLSMSLGIFLLTLAAMMLVLSAGAQQTVLPLGRRGRARTSLEGDLGHQIDQAEREPGIRRQL